MPRTFKTQSDLRSFIPPGWNQTLRRSSLALLIHPTPYLPIIFTVVPYNRFRDLVFRWRRQGLILPGHICISEGRSSFDFGEITPGQPRTAMEGSVPPCVWPWRRALLMAFGGKLTPVIIDNFQTCQWALCISRRGAGGGRKKVNWKKCLNVSLLWGKCCLYRSKVMPFVLCISQLSEVLSSSVTEVYAIQIQIFLIYK